MKSKCKMPFPWTQAEPVSLQRMSALEWVKSLSGSRGLGVSGSRPTESISFHFLHPRTAALGNQPALWGAQARQPVCRHHQRPQKLQPSGYANPQASPGKPSDSNSSESSVSPSERHSPEDRELTELAQMMLTYALKPWPSAFGFYFKQEKINGPPFCCTCGTTVTNCKVLQRLCDPADMEDLWTWTSSEQTGRPTWLKAEELLARVWTVGEKSFWKLEKRWPQILQRQKAWKHCHLWHYEKTFNSINSWFWMSVTQ